MSKDFYHGTKSISQAFVHTPLIRSNNNAPSDKNHGAPLM